MNPKFTTSDLEKNTWDRETNNCTLSHVIGCFVVLGSRSFWQTLVRTLLNFAANGNWDNCEVSWHLEAKSILTRKSGLEYCYPVHCIVRLKNKLEYVHFKNPSVYRLFHFISQFETSESSAIIYFIFNDQILWQKSKYLIPLTSTLYEFCF